MTQLLNSSTPYIITQSSSNFSGFSEYAQYYDSISFKVQGVSSTVSTTYKQTSTGIQITSPQVSLSGNLTVAGRITIPGYGTIQPGVAFTNDYNSLLNKPDLLNYGKLNAPNVWSATNIFSTLQTTVTATSQYDVVNYETLNNIFDTENTWTQRQNFLLGTVETDPVFPTDIANKKYVDAQIGGGSGVTTITSNGSLLPSTTPGSNSYNIVINPDNSNRWSAPQIFDGLTTFNSDTEFNSSNNIFQALKANTQITVSNGTSSVVITPGTGSSTLNIQGSNPNKNGFSYIGGTDSGIIINSNSNIRPMLNYFGSTYPSTSSGIATLSDISGATVDLLASNNTWTGTNTFNNTISVPNQLSTDNSQKAANTSYVTTAINNYNNYLKSANNVWSGYNTWTSNNDFSNNVTVPTRPVGDNTLNAANTSFVKTAITNSTSNLLISNNTWTGINTFNNTIYANSYLTVNNTFRTNNQCFFSYGYGGSSGLTIFSNPGGVNNTAYLGTDNQGSGGFNGIVFSANQSRPYLNNPGAPVTNGSALATISDISDTTTQLFSKINTIPNSINTVRWNGSGFPIFVVCSGGWSTNQGGMEFQISPDNYTFYSVAFAGSFSGSGIAGTVSLSSMVPSGWFFRVTSGNNNGVKMSIFSTTGNFT